jgi:ribonuclease III
MNLLEGLQSKLPLIEQKLCYMFHNKELLTLSFIHRSFFNEHKALLKENNERLEFLGDSVLGLIISDYLYAHLPDAPEGHLSQLRSYIVEAGSCAQFLNQLEIAEFVLLGKGERMNDGRGRETILADLFEAMIGAIYLDGGMDAAKTFFFFHFSNNIQEHLKAPIRNWKAELQDYSQKKHQKPPVYKIQKESGPDHSKVFQVVVSVDGIDVGEGVGSSKKEAEAVAAEDALDKLGVIKNG